MQLEGTLIVINDTEEVGTSGFQKRECVLKTDEQYVQEILVQFSGTKINLLNDFNIGDKVKISINIQGKSWVNPQGETKYFNTISGWQIIKTQ